MEPQVRFAYMAISENDPVLNLTIGREHLRYRIDREQLFRLNAQIVDILKNGRVSEEHAADEQLALKL